MPVNELCGKEHFLQDGIQNNNVIQTAIDRFIWFLEFGDSKFLLGLILVQMAGGKQSSKEVRKDAKDPEDRNRGAKRHERRQQRWKGPTNPVRKDAPRSSEGFYRRQR